MKSYIDDLKEKVQLKDKECDELIKKNPAGYHDKEFEELLMLKCELKGAEKAMKERCHWIRHDDELQKLIYEKIGRWRKEGRQWSGTYFTSSIFRLIARLLEEERAETLKGIKEITETLYAVNSKVISLQWIGMKQKPTEKEIEQINEVLGNQIKKLREISERAVNN